jgi:hypothetical protein
MKRFVVQLRGGFEYRLKADSFLVIGVDMSITNYELILQKGKPKIKKKNT